MGFKNLIMGGALMLEEGRKIVCAGDGNYEVSSLGNIRKIKHGKLSPVYPGKDSGGYYRVCISGKSYAVHRLVATAFIPNPYGYPIVHHIDEDKTNNAKENLIWCTYQQNRIFGVPATSGKNAQRHYTVLQLSMDGELVAKWNSFSEAAHSLGVKSISLISKCAHHQRNSAYGFRWKIQRDNDHKFSFALAQQAFEMNPEKTIKALRGIVSTTKI